MTRQEKVFTTDSDFALGVFDGVNSNAPSSHQLQLNDTSRVEPYLWVANASYGTVTKIDTQTGRQVARYDSVLVRNWDGSVPSVRPPRDTCNYPVPTVVDAQGNAFVVNRTNCLGVSASITKYAGSLAACVDRNGNGQIDTSRDLNNDGIVNLIDQNEFRGQADECILWTKNYAAASDQGRALAVDTAQNVWVGGNNTSKLYQLNGQTGQVLKVIDLKAETGQSAGIHGLAVGPGDFLYTSDNTSVRAIRKIDPSSTTGKYVVSTLTSPIPTYGIAVDRNGIVWLGADADFATGLVRADFTAGNIRMVSGGCSGRTRGIAVDTSGDIWAACYSANRLMRLNSSGTSLAFWSLGVRPEGVAVDAQRKVWVNSAANEMSMRIDPAVPGTFQSFPSGGSPLTYSDMTGFHHRNFLARQGTWAVVHDSGRQRTHWGPLTWNLETQGSVPAGTSLTVAVRAAEARETLANQPFTTISNGLAFAGIDGRFIEVKVTLSVQGASASPVLSDLTLHSSNNRPVAVCQDQSVCAGATSCTATASINNGSYDPDGDPVSTSQSPAGPYPLGNNAVSLSASDAVLVGTCTATVNVNDCEPPSITCAPAVVAECTGAGSATVSTVGAQATDTCSTVNVSGPGSQSYPLGSTPVTYTATDGAGNTASCSTHVEVVDTKPPSITCPGPVTAECVNGGTTPEVLGSATASDVCSTVSVTAPSGATLPLGTTPVQYTATDTSGNSAACTTQVTVVDTKPPSLALNGATAYTHECAAPFADPGATATDQCLGDMSQRVTVSGTVDPHTLGTYTITYNATDLSGLSAPPVSRTVQVKDTQGPVISLNGANPTNLECMRDWYEELGATATDACTQQSTDKITITGGNINSSAEGSHQVTYTVADAGGNVAKVVRQVNVRDTLPPGLFLNGPSMVLLECKEGVFEDDPGAAANDLCYGNLSASITQSGTVDNTVPGSYPITYRVEDPAGLESEVVRDVKVVDTKVPLLTVVGDPAPVIECNIDNFIDLGAIATDSCAGDITNRITVSGTADISHPGVYPITYSVTDPSGNAATSVTRSVYVQDTRKPVLTMNGSDSMVLECGQSTYTEPGATAHDACLGDVTHLVSIYGNGANTGAVGTYSIQYSIYDTSGNTSELIRTVNVVDTSPPTLTLLGAANMRIECGGTFVDPGATASDACYGNLTSSILREGGVNTRVAGAYRLTYSVKDSSNLSSPTRERYVAVSDRAPPVVTTRPVVVEPADHSIRYFTLADCLSIQDVCDGTLDPEFRASIISIYSDEPEDAPGDADGETTGDIVITGKTSFQLRAERNSTGNGRVYGVNYRAFDKSDNFTTGTCYFKVGAGAQDNGPASGYVIVPGAPQSSMASR